MHPVIEGMHKLSQLAKGFFWGSAFPVARAPRVTQGQTFLSIAHIHVCVHVAADLD